MQEITIGTNEAGQRLDKFLAKYMKLAPKSFFYKMMRKKNITLNGKKCEGGEMLAEGDTVKLFLADETIEKFSEIKVQKIQKEKKVQLSILYEDEDILLINKSAGMLSQKDPCGALSPRCATGWTGIPAESWQRGNPWRAHRCFRRCSGTGRSTNITSASFTDRSGRPGPLTAGF